MTALQRTKTAAQRKRDQRRNGRVRWAARREQKRRLRQANNLLRVIASTGRRFFGHGRRVSYLYVSPRGHVWFVDSYTQRRVYTHYHGPWKGFTNGGTMRNLVSALRDYVKRGTLLPAFSFGPWPRSFCGGDLWGYGKDMKLVREAAAGMLRPAWPPPRGKKAS